MTRRQFTTFSAISLSVILLSARSGFAQSGRWALLATGVVAMFLASFAAPEYFGWRGPDDAELHQRRRLSVQVLVSEAALQRATSVAEFLGSDWQTSASSSPRRSPSANAATGGRRQLSVRYPQPAVHDQSAARHYLGQRRFGRVAKCVTSSASLTSSNLRQDQESPANVCHER